MENPGPEASGTSAAVGAPGPSRATCLADRSPSRSWLPLQAWTRATERGRIPGGRSQGFPGPTGVASGQLGWDSSKTSCRPSHLGHTAPRPPPSRAGVGGARKTSPAKSKRGREDTWACGQGSRWDRQPRSQQGHTKVTPGQGRHRYLLISEMGIKIRLREILMNSTKPMTC